MITNRAQITKSPWSTTIYRTTVSDIEKMILMVGREYLVWSSVA
ncbi:7375_t:CDS:1, partial [Ambispora leptoticha]